MIKNRINSLKLAGLMFLLLVSTSSFGQMYVGLGYGQVSTYWWNTADGVILTAQKDFQIKESRWSISPTVKVGFFYSEMGDYHVPTYANTISASVPLSFQVISKKRFAFNLFAGPYITQLRVFGVEYYLDYLKRKDYAGVFDFSETIDINNTYVHLEIGCTVDINVSDKLNFRVMPLMIQFKKPDNTGWYDSNKSNGIQFSAFSVLIKI